MPVWAGDNVEWNKQFPASYLSFGGGWAAVRIYAPTITIALSRFRATFGRVAAASSVTRPTRDELAEALAEVLGNDVSRYKMLRAADAVLRLLARDAGPREGVGA